LTAARAALVAAACWAAAPTAAAQQPPAAAAAAPGSLKLSRGSLGTQVPMGLRTYKVPANVGGLTLSPNLGSANLLPPLGIIPAGGPKQNLWDYTGVDPATQENTLGNYINDAVGAGRFYQTGVYDTNSNNVIGIFGQDTYTIHIDAGHPWAGPSGHSVLSGVDVNNPVLRYSPRDAQGNVLVVTEPEAHPTQIAHVIAGAGQELRNGSTTTVRIGIAPFTNLGSGAIATSVATDGSGQFEMTPKTYLDTFKHFAEATFDREITYPLFAGATQTYTVNGPTDVINASFGFTDPAGVLPETVALDALAKAHPKTTFVVSAGNSGPDTNTVGGPASGYNRISVGATGDTTINGLDEVAFFSSRGAQDFALDPNNPTAAARVAKGVRAPVDIVAPGVYLVMASYNGPTSTPDDAVAASGTSFAAPIVAAGVSLIDSLSYHLTYTVQFNTPGENWDSSRDARLVKAVLMNSADKLPGWNNGQQSLTSFRGFSNVTRTRQALDMAQGAGSLNLDRAFDQYLGGTLDPFGYAGPVYKTGWSLAKVQEGSTLDYVIDGAQLAGSTLDATLVWFRDRILPTVDPLTDDWDPDTSALVDTDLGMALLYLEIWDAAFTKLYAISDTDYNTAQHLHFVLPENGLYAIRVNYDHQLFGTPDPAGETFGLAWNTMDAVPEPSALLGVFAMASLSVLGRRRRGV
jgi:hypothetical protein